MDQSFYCHKASQHYEITTVRAPKRKCDTPAK